MSIELLLYGASGRMGSEVRRLLGAPPKGAGKTSGAAAEAPIHLTTCVARGRPKSAPTDGSQWIEAASFGPREIAALPADGVVLDVSLADGTDALIAALESSPRPAVFATTGLAPATEARILALGDRVPVLRARNLSLGVAVARRWLELLPAVAREAYVADIVEQHHAAKKDAPSGTALDLAAALGPIGDGGDPRRAGAPVPIVSLRAGTVPGTHRVVLSGDGETLELTHTVYDRSVFARGALRAVRFVHGREPGFYSIDDLVHGGPKSH